MDRDELTPFAIKADPTRILILLKGSTVHSTKVIFISVADYASIHHSATPDDSFPSLELRTFSEIKFSL